MKNELQARIRYNKEKDAYELQLSSDGGKEWSVSISSKCQLSARNDANDEPEFVHISFIEEMKKAIANGFEIVW